MGAHPWFYFVPYENEIARSLEKLRQQEFLAGRYNPCEAFPNFPVNPRHAPGRGHPSIEAARAAAGPSGTRSILDMRRITDGPAFGTVSPLDDAELLELFGSTSPSRTAVESSDDLFDGIERGHGIYVIVYEHRRPVQIYFAGYSYD
jgi:hypothetical protein